MKSWGGCLKLSARKILFETARNCRLTTTGAAGRTAAAAAAVGPSRSNLVGAVRSVASSVEGQRRSFVSVPKSKDWASRSRAAVNNPILMSHPSNAAAVVSPRTKNEALFAAAEEADRLMLLNDTFAPNTTSSSTNTSIEEQPDKHPAFHGPEYKDHQDILDAANALLLVSNDPVLQNFIATSSRRHTQETSPGNELVGKQIATIHRAFLSLTKKCLEHCEESGDPALFHAALELARRAHDQLHLPFHLPLYQRLMEIAPSFTNKSSETVLEIVSFCQTLSLEAVRTSALFGPVLKAMIAQGKLNDAALLLQAMKFRFDVAHWDRQTVSDIYVQLHRATKNSFLTTGRRDFPVEPCTNIVQFLEVGILSAQLENLKDAKQDLMAMYKRIGEAIYNRDDDEIARLLDELAAMNDDDDDDDDEEYDSDGEAHFAGLDHDPLDQVVHSILTRRVVSPAARRQFAEMISKAKPPRMVPKSIEIVPVSDKGIHSNSQSKGGGMKVIVSVKSSRSPSPRRSSFSLPPAWYGDPHRFPDVTAQVMRLSQGRRVEFTPAYEDYLWKRLAESDDDFDGEYDDSDYDDNDDSDDDSI